MDYFCFTTHHTLTPPPTPKSTLTWPPDRSKAKRDKNLGARKDYVAYAKWHVECLETKLDGIVADDRRAANTQGRDGSTTTDTTHSQLFAVKDTIDIADTLLSATKISSGIPLVLIDHYSTGLGCFMPGDLTGFMLTHNDYEQLQHQWPKDKLQRREAFIKERQRRREMARMLRDKEELDKRMGGSSGSSGGTTKTKKKERYEFADKKSGLLKRSAPGPTKLGPIAAKPGARIPVPVVKPTEKLLEDHKSAPAPTVPALVLTDPEGKDFFLVDPDGGSLPGGVSEQTIREPTGRISGQEEFSIPPRSFYGQDHGM